MERAKGSQVNSKDNFFHHISAECVKVKKNVFDFTNKGRPSNLAKSVSTCYLLNWKSVAL